MESTMGCLYQLVWPGGRRYTETGTGTHIVFSWETLSIVQNLGLTTEENKSVDAIIRAIKQYIDGYINESMERRNFCKCKQQTGESFDDFLISLRELVKTCNFCSDNCANKTYAIK